VKVFVQAKGESIVINGEIIVTIVDILDEDVVLAVDTQNGSDVCKEEMLEEIGNSSGSPTVSGPAAGFPNSPAIVMLFPDRQDWPFFFAVCSETSNSFLDAEAGTVI